MKVLPLIILNCHLKGFKYTTAEIILQFTLIKWNNLCRVFMEYSKSMAYMGTFGLHVSCDVCI